MSLTVHGRWLAVVLACGHGALLSHSSAAALWGLVPMPGGVIHVTACGRARRARDRIALHQVRTLHHDDRDTRESIPVTSVARTLFDLAGVTSRGRLERAFEEADRLRLLDVGRLSGVCARRPRARGARTIRALLERSSTPVVDARSELERRFASLCRDAGLPRPAINVQVEGFEVDAVWPDRRVVVELDGFSFHRTRAAFERDRMRDATLQLAGYRVIRVTHRRLETEPAVVAEIVGDLLRAV